MSRYIRDQWGTEQGYPGGPVYSIAQTGDGYLWLGTQKGLVRFDGFSFHLAPGANSAEDPAGPVLGLATDSSGDLWVRPRSPSLLSYRGGAFRSVMFDGVTAMCRGKNSDIIFSTLGNGILRTRAGKLEPLTLTATLPNFPVLSLAETPDGRVWIGTRDAGLFMLSEGKISTAVPGLPDRKINCLLATGNGELWIGTDKGVVRWSSAGITRQVMPWSLDRVQALAMIQDRESNVWIGTSGGLVRVSAHGPAALETRDHQSGEAVTALFEDREGNLWTGSASGVQRLRDSVFITYTSSDEPSEAIGPVYAGAEDRTWFAPTDGGLYWVKDGQIGQVKEAGLIADVVYSIAGANGELWIGRQRGGLTHLQPKAGGWVSVNYTQREGLSQNSVYSVYRSRDGTIWAGTLSGGVSKLSGGRFTNYTISNGLASNTVTAILETSDGTMWFATPNGLSGLSKDRWLAFAVRDGLPSNDVNCLFEDSQGVLWAGTSAGLAFFSSGRIQPAPTSTRSLHEQILGLAEDRNGWLWIATSNHVLRVNRDHLMRDALGEGDVREYGVADGLRSIEGVKRHLSVVADQRGRIWISTNRGLSVVDPARQMSGPAAALVHIQTISADGATIDLRSGVRIPGGHKRITFAFAGLNLTVPERVQFKFTLDGFDHGWNGPVTRRDATYTNLSPGPYRFRVIASNSDGLWNGSEAAIGFEVDPVFWQTRWFQLSVVLGCVLAVILLYRFRLHQLNLRFEERLAERTRIAQELHDTLLQGFLSASMQLHVAVDKLPDESPARPSLTRILELMGRVIEEGRNAVRGLRASASGSRDLEQALSRIQQELAIDTGTGFYIIVEGRPRPLHPVLRDEVYQISREALVNAFRHSRARKIEVQLEYGFSRLRIHVSDDGCGIDPEVLRTGRDGHWGLPGMRERAERIGAKLHVWSSATAGTEVELSVPSHIAFQDQPSNGVLAWLSKLYSRKSAGEK